MQFYEPAAATVRAKRSRNLSLRLEVGGKDDFFGAERLLKGVLRVELIDRDRVNVDAALFELVYGRDLVALEGA
ncbi:MAG: hypothetical protein WAP35_04930 [Solirubrobacterales bacterium]